MYHPIYLSIPPAADLGVRHVHPISVVVKLMSQAIVACQPLVTSARGIFYPLTLVPSKAPVFLILASVKKSVLLTGPTQSSVYCAHSHTSDRESTLLGSVDLASNAGGPVNDLLRLEPEVELANSTLGTIRAVADVAVNLNSEVTTDGTRSRVSRASSTEKSAATLDDTSTLPAHSNDGTRGEVVAEIVVEGLVLEVNVVLTSLLLGGLKHLETSELVALVLEALDDLTNETALNTIGLNSDEGALSASTRGAGVGFLFGHFGSRSSYTKRV